LSWLPAVDLSCTRQLVQRQEAELRQNTALRVRGTAGQVTSARGYLSAGVSAQKKVGGTVIGIPG